jgi:predicted lipid-binding transport protein (Tim44 family)
MPELAQFNWDVVDILVLVVAIVVVASLFLRFRLPWDERPKSERKGWREVVEKFQPAKRKDAENVKSEPLPPMGQSVHAPPRNLALRAKGKLVVPQGKTGLAAVKAVDANFDEAGFVKGAKEAYLFFHDKWAAGDEAEMAQLCSPRLLDEIANGEAGKAPGKASEVKSAKISGARLNGRTAVVDVEFEAKHGSKTVKSHWTLARAVGGLDPNWELQGFKLSK